MSIQKFAKSTTNPVGFIASLPDTYHPSNKYPLLIFLHGNGQQGGGTDADLQVFIDSNDTKELLRGVSRPWTVAGKNYEFILLAPQMSGGWNKEINHVQKMLDHATTLSIDWNKVYLTGLSRGGEAVWGFPTWSAANAAKIAAVVPVCAVWPMLQGAICNFSRIGVWAFHAENDGIVGVGNTKALVDQINACPGISVPAKKTIYPAGDHWIWGRVYNPDFIAGKEGRPGIDGENVTIYEWMLMCSVGNPVPVPSGMQASTATSAAVSSGFQCSIGDDFETDKQSVQLFGKASGGEWKEASWSLVEIPEGVNIWRDNVWDGGTGWISVKANLPKVGRYVFQLDLKDVQGNKASSKIAVTYKGIRKPKITIPVVDKSVVVYEDWTYEIK